MGDDSGTGQANSMSRTPDTPPSGRADLVQASPSIYGGNSSQVLGRTVLSMRVASRFSFAAILHPNKFKRPHTGSLFLLLACTYMET